MLLIVSVRPLPCQVRLLGRSKNLIKKRIFLGFEGGDGTGLFIYLFCPALPLLCWTGSLFPYLSTHFLVSAGRIPKHSTSYTETNVPAGISTNYINSSPKGIFCYRQVNFLIYYYSLSALSYLPAFVEQLTISYIIS